MKKYYTEREQGLNPIEFQTLRSSFLGIYKYFFHDNYLTKDFLFWKDPQIEIYLFGKIGIWNIWPFDSNSRFEQKHMQ